MASAGGVAGGVAAALSSGGSDDVPRKVNNLICQMLPKLDKNAITKRETKLCEAFCLLWHHRRLGTVDGRQTSEKLISCAYAAVILDLWAASKIEIIVKGKLKDDYIRAIIKVTGTTKTGSVLDAAGFSKMARHHEQGKTRELIEWIEGCVICKPDNNCASVILDSFVDKGIVGMQDKWFGFRRVYPTKDKEPQIQLVLEIRGITLRDIDPDGFMRALLPLLRFADNLHDSEDPLLGRYFNQNEYTKAKPRLDEILRDSGYVKWKKGLI